MNLKNGLILKNRSDFENYSHINLIRNNGRKLELDIYLLNESIMQQQGQIGAMIIKNNENYKKSI